MVTASFFYEEQNPAYGLLRLLIKTEQTIGLGTINMVVKGSPFYSILAKIPQKNTKLIQSGSKTSRNV